MIFYAHTIFLFVFDDGNQNLFPMKELAIVWSKPDDNDVNDDEFDLLEENANRLFGEKRGVFDQRPGQWEYQGVRRNMPYNPMAYEQPDTDISLYEIQSGAELFWHDIFFDTEEDAKKFTKGQTVKVPFFD